MAFSYSENLANFEQWTFRQSSFEEDSSWMSSIQETETLTKALQQSFSGTDYYSSDQQFIMKPEEEPIFPTTTTTTTPTVSGSDPETTSTTTTTTTSKQQQQQQRRNYNHHHHQKTLKGKISKRKSRATNRSPVTFITADPLNFRQMVQQVTGIREGGGNLHLPVTQIMKPGAKRPGGVDLMLINGGYTLPTLDTSAAFLLEQQQAQQLMGGSTTSSTVTSPTHHHVSSSYHATAPQQVVARVVNNTSFDFDTFQSFPTLESWGVI